LIIFGLNFYQFSVSKSYSTLLQMKKYLFLTAFSFVALIIAAQEINPDDFPPLVRDQLIEEEFLFINDESLEDQSNESTVTYTYKGAARNGSSDTVYCFIWDRVNEDWMNYHRTIKLFDESEQLTEQIFQFWSKENTWLNGTRYVLAYNGNGMQIQKDVQVWHPKVNDWVNFSRNITSYNEQGQVSAVVMQKFVIDLNDWKNRHQILFTYDEATVITADTFQIWNRMNQSWMNEKMHKFFFDSTGSLVHKVTLRKRHEPATPWIRFYRESFEYGDDSKIILKKFERWNNEFQQWVNEKRTLFAYTAEGKIDSRVHQKWHRWQIWENGRKESFFYNDAGLLGEHLFQEWNIKNSIWVNHSHDLLTYDGSGTLTEKLLQRWDRPAIDWKNFKKWVISLQYKSGQMASSQDGNDEDAVSLSFKNPYTYNSPVYIKGLPQGSSSLKVVNLQGSVVFESIVSCDGPVYLDRVMENGLYLIVVQNGKKILNQEKLLILN
jgi:hypothetical protein